MSQFCETSFRNGKLSAELTASYQCVLRFFHSICPKYCACHKVKPGHAKRCTCHAKSSQQPWRSDAPKCNPLRKSDQRPDLLTCLTHVALVFRLPRDMHLCRSSSSVPRLPTFLKLLQNPRILLTFGRYRIPCACHAKPHPNFQNQKWSDRQFLNTFDFKMCFVSQRRARFEHLNLQKCSEPGVFFTLLTSTCASRHNGVHFFDIATSKSGPTLVCFVHFDFEMCFVLQKACNFSSLICPDGSAPAALASLLFDPPEPQNIGKTQCFATFIPFRTPASSFFWLFLSSDLLSSSLLFSDSSHLCFFIRPFCQKFDF